MIRIIGVGSRFGEDAAGLEAARWLRNAPPKETEVVMTERPGMELIDLIDGCDAVILIDAVHSGTAAGTVHDVDLWDVPHRRLRPISDHGVGLGEAVDLAKVLGRLPDRGRLLGIEIPADPGQLDEPLSSATLAGIAKAVSRSQKWATLFACQTPRIGK